MDTLKQLKNTLPSLLTTVGLFLGLRLFWLELWIH